MAALATLLDPLFTGAGSAVDSDVQISGISDDSRTVKPGDLFVAVSGAELDGHHFVADAVSRGAAAVVAERPLPEIEIPLVVMPDLALKRGAIASRLYGDPSAALCCVGVTGTNGKTSIACFISELAVKLGESAGYMGTIGWGSPGELAPSALTTEGAITVQRRLAELATAGKRWAVLEASSHALDQHRLDAVQFDYAVLSNLTRDHLDYHQSYDGYRAAKARLFEGSGLRAVVLNIDDEFGRALTSRVDESVAVLTYGSSADADISWHDVAFSREGICGQWRTRWGCTPFELPLYGGFSVANVAAALGVLCHAGFELELAVAACRSLSAVPGRMEFFFGQPTIVVDYAHTPDALDKMLQALRPHTDGRVICVFGCGGDRDRGKRPQMARAAFEGADVIWMTSDNPRGESPQLIIDEMRKGLPGSKGLRSKQAQVNKPAGETEHTRVNECLDRREAIDHAVAAAEPHDLVVIAGKGHEDYQEIMGRRMPFSDRAIAREITGGM